MRKAKNKNVASVCWFEIPADEPARAREFYGKLFGWKFNPLPQMADYSHIDTGGAEASPDGGLMRRMHPGHSITTYVSVPSISRAVAKVSKLGGLIVRPKTAVAGMGYLAICQDTESNVFALWEMNPKAK